MKIGIAMFIGGAIAAIVGWFLLKGGYVFVNHFLGSDPWFAVPNVAVLWFLGVLVLLGGVFIFLIGVITLLDAVGILSW